MLVKAFGESVNIGSSYEKIGGLSLVLLNNFLK